MKIRIKQVDWSGWNGGSSIEKELEYEVKLKKEVIVNLQNMQQQKNLYLKSVLM